VTRRRRRRRVRLPERRTARLAAEARARAPGRQAHPSAERASRFPVLAVAPFWNWSWGTTVAEPAHPSVENRTVSSAVSRPSSRGSVSQGLVSARAGRPHPRAPWPRPRHQRGTTRRRAAPRRARGDCPGHFVDHLVGDGQCWVKREKRAAGRIGP
jgi:hypothetical protein